jgi:hypothetical protein
MFCSKRGTETLDDSQFCRKCGKALSVAPSGKVTVGNFSVNLPSDAATYFLVFDNRFSLLSKKEG